MVFRSHQFFLHVHVEIQISTIGDRVPPLQSWSMTWPTEYGIFDSDSSGSHSRTAIESPFPHPIWSVRSGSQFRLEKRERTSSGRRRSRGVINPRRRPPPLLGKGRLLRSHCLPEISNITPLPITKSVFTRPTDLDEELAFDTGGREECNATPAP
jgi:hypothetical protein